MASTQLTLPYGSSAIRLHLDARHRPLAVEPRDLPAPETPEKVLRRALESPVASPPLRELARGRRSAAILIPGRTRVAGTSEYVPALLAELAAGGIAADDVTVHLATGTHEHHLEGDVVRLLGAELAARVRCVAHACDDPDGLTSLGTTRRGTPVAIDRRVLAADLKILTGRIVPHYFAGMSGGRKALVPGVAGFETILANHRLTLAPDRGIDPRVGCCALAGNPVHEDLVEAASLAQPDFCLNTILDDRGALVAAVAGDWQEAFALGCRTVERHFRVRVREPLDVLITSPGGRPHDGNFMQSIKAVLNLAPIVRPGGAILWLAECDGGVHPGFFGWADVRDDAELDRRVRADYALTGHNAILLRRLQRRAEVHLHSALPAADVARLGFHPTGDPASRLDEILERFGPAPRIGVARCANVLCASLEDGVAA